MTQPDFAHEYPKRGKDIDHPGVKAYYAEARDFEVELLRRLKAGEESEPWHTQQRAKLREKLEILCAPEPSLPEGWRGARPEDDVCTLMGLRQHVNDGIATFHALPPSDDDDDALELDRLFVCDAYRAAIHLGKVSAIPISDELRDANAIENCWHKLRDALSSTPKKRGEAECTISTPSLDARALAAFIENPTWRKDQIAKYLGAHPKSLAPKRCPKLAAAIAAYKAPSLPRGSKDSQGNIEAWQE